MFQHLQGWQKVLGLLAVAMTLVIVLNPEFLALGLLGDAALFDMLALAISLQLQAYVGRVWLFLRAELPRTLRWFVTPGLETRYVVYVSMLYLASAASAVQKALHK